MSTARIELPPKLLKVFGPPRGSLRYRGAYGGRGSGKSFTFAKMAAIWGVVEPLRILCTRELQDSIKESFHAELKNAIASEPWLAAAYDVGIDYLRGRIPGRDKQTEFLFKGLRHNIGSIKSTAQIDLCIVEEAEDVPEASWRDLEPTIRAPNSEIWVIWNPRKDGSPVDQRFRKNTPPRSRIVEMNYTDNPWFPDVLEEQRQHQQRTLDPETYAHIWLGQYLKIGKASVFGNRWRQDDFTPSADWSGPYYGLDFGFANDPTAGVKCWIHDGRLYVEYETGGVGVEIDDTAPMVLRDLPGVAEHDMRADNARPESISYLKRNGLPRVRSCEKGKGSVEDGIAHIKSYTEIIIHPRCTRTANEFLLYSYKVDRLSGDILPVLVDDNNHWIDACIEEGSLISTLSGLKRIEDVSDKDFVLTRKGFMPVGKMWLAHEDAEIWDVFTDHGLVLSGTRDHRVYTENRGFVRIDALRYNDEIVIDLEALCEKSKQQSMQGWYGADIPAQKTDPIENISREQCRTESQNSYIGLFMSGKWGQSLMAITSTTKTKIAKTTKLAILSALRQSNTPSTMNRGAETLSPCERTLIESGRFQKHGTPAQRGLRSIAGLERWLTRILIQKKKAASIAEVNSCQVRLGIETYFAQGNASQQQEGILELTTWNLTASSAGQYFQETSIQKQRLAQGRVQTVCATARKANVYDIEVMGVPEFFANGVLVHNCRYALEPVMKKRKSTFG